MTKQTRHSVFETNSSSTHSISIAYSSSVGDLMSILPVNDEGNVVLNGGEFGWADETFHNAQTKASYLAVYCMQWCGDRKDDFLSILFDVIKKQTGCHQIILNFTCEYTSTDDQNWSYIDHQSAESQDYHYLFENPEQIRQFIFNPNSTLTTGNDNGPYSDSDNDEDYDEVEEESTEDNEQDESDTTLNDSGLK